MQRSELIKKLKDQNLIKEDEVLKLVVEHDKKELDKLKKEFDEKYEKLKKEGRLKFST